MPRRVMCIAVTVAALSLAVLSSACSQEQISEQPALVRSAEQGDAAAQFDLGDRYFNGDGVPQDDGEAVRWFRLAADQGDARAQDNLGISYGNGRGVPQDESEAVRWFRLAAAQGDASAQANLGGRYATGRGVPQDDGEAVRWFRLAAAQGNARAQTALGLRYATGRGVPQDESEAVRWYRLAAEQGDARVQVLLGTMYHTGDGVPQDESEAVRWYRLAAHQGNAEAQYVLGAMYANGKGVPQAAPCIQTEFSPAALELVRLYEELHTFKDDPEFLRVGFVRGGPYSAWMQAVEKHQDENPGFELSDELGFLTNEVLMLGMNYMSEEFSESELSAIEYFEGKIQTGLAAARCTELGSKLPETIQAASEARQRYTAEAEAQIAARESLLGRPLNEEELIDIAIEKLRGVLEAGEEYPGQRAEQTALAKLRPLFARAREIGEQRKREYDAALARFAAAVAAAAQGQGTYTASLAAGEALLALATEIAAEMSALATELAAVQATAPPTVVAFGAPHLIAIMEQAEIFESAVAELQDQLVLMRAMTAELAELEQLRR